MKKPPPRSGEAAFLVFLGICKIRWNDKNLGENGGLSDRAGCSLARAEARSLRFAVLRRLRSDSVLRKDNLPAAGLGQFGISRRSVTRINRIVFGRNSSSLSLRGCTTFFRKRAFSGRSLRRRASLDAGLRGAEASAHPAQRAGFAGGGQKQITGADRLRSADR